VIVVSVVSFVFSCGTLVDGRQDSEQQILSRGATLEQQGEFAQAKSEYLEGLRQFPESSELSFRAGLIYLRENAWPDAVQVLQHAQAARPRHVDTLYYLAQAYYLDGQLRPALATIDRAARLAPNRPDVAQKFGEYLCEAKACTEGLKQLLKARRLDPTLENIDFDLGMAYHRQAVIPDARRYLDAALKKNPENLTAARFLADVFAREGQWDKAKELYDQVVTRDPRNAWALYGLGRTWIGMGEYDASLQPLRQALVVEPTLAEAHFQLGHALRRLGRTEEAQRELMLFQAIRGRTESSTPALKADRTPFETRIWETCRRMLAEHDESGSLSYLESLKIPETSERRHYLIGALYYNVDRPADAVRLLEQAAERPPRDAEALAFLGRAYVAVGQYDRAQVTLARSQALSPDGELVLVGLGELAFAIGNWDEAIRAFEQSKTRQVPALLKLCRSYVRVGNRAKALEIAELVRVFGARDPTWTPELDAILASANDSPVQQDRRQ
jgi:tetratricopeptide (TPR) repeat protein